MKTTTAKHGHRYTPFCFDDGRKRFRTLVAAAMGIGVSFTGIEMFLGLSVRAESIATKGLYSGAFFGLIAAANLHRALRKSSILRPYTYQLTVDQTRRYYQRAQAACVVTGLVVGGGAGLGVGHHFDQSQTQVLKKIMQNQSDSVRPGRFVFCTSEQQFLR